MLIKRLFLLHVLGHSTNISVVKIIDTRREADSCCCSGETAIVMLVIRKRSKVSFAGYCGSDTGRPTPVILVWC
jgi:hypothetical protein